MSGESSATAVFDPDPESVSGARRLFKTVVAQAGTDPEVAGDGVLLVSELVTNAFVHGGTAAEVYIRATTTGVRVEVLDGGTHRPMRRNFATTAGTGRGLQMLDQLAHRWGVEPFERGKFVWFELGELGPAGDQADPSRPSRDFTSAPDGPFVSVTLRKVPLLMHAAWQEHAAALLRELLLWSLRSTVGSMEAHAQASQAMSLLNEQLPRPALDEHPDMLMAGAIEPQVTADEVVLRVPSEALDHFVTLAHLLATAIANSRAGEFLCPPTQPEMSELGEWLCSEVARQGSGATSAGPWSPRTDIRATLADQEVLEATYARLALVDEPLLATDGASIIVAASEPALAVLGYQRADQLVGRRVIVVVPPRFHQAHIAGTTLHETNGRDNLIGVPLTVPMMRADGTEVDVDIEVQSEKLSPGHSVFVARFQPTTPAM